VLYRLLSRTDKSRFEHRVISLAGTGPVGNAIQALGVEVSNLELQSRSPLRGLWRLHRCLIDPRPDILQTWLPHADLLGLIAGRAAGVPAIAWNIRSSYVDLTRYSVRTALTFRLCALLSRFPQRVVFNSEAGLRYYRSIGYRPRRWEVIPNGFDLDHFSPAPARREQIRAELRLPEETPVVGLVARFDAMKDHETFLQAAARLNEVRPGVHFVLAGMNVDDGNSRLRDRVDELGLSGTVHLLGERSDVEAVYNALDVCTLSSYGEGFPNVVGEAMACGVPCVVTDVGDAASIVADTGIAVPARDASGLAAGWLSLLDLAPAQRREKGRRARERVVRHYSLERMVSRYERLYLEMAACGGRRVRNLGRNRPRKLA